MRRSNAFPSIVIVSRRPVTAFPSAKNFEDIVAGAMKSGQIRAEQIVGGGINLISMK